MATLDEVLRDRSVATIAITITHANAVSASAMVRSPLRPRCAGAPFCTLAAPIPVELGIGVRWNIAVSTLAVARLALRWSTAAARPGSNPRAVGWPGGCVATYGAGANPGWTAENG